MGKAICKKKSAVQSKFLHGLICVSLSCSLHFVLWPIMPLKTITHIWGNMENAHCEAPVLNTAFKMKLKE